MFDEVPQEILRLMRQAVTTSLGNLPTNEERVYLATALRLFTYEQEQLAGAGETEEWEELLPLPGCKN